MAETANLEPQVQIKFGARPALGLSFRRVFMALTSWMQAHYQEKQRIRAAGKNPVEGALDIRDV